MTRKPGPGICIHCLADVPNRNWDHVFPQGWYPDSTPPNLEKWKIPSCIPCNNQYGQIEDDLGIILSMCVDPKSAQASGIWPKSLRAIDPSQGKTEKDRQARARKKEQLLRTILKGEEIPGHGIYPGLGERWGRPREEQVAIPIPAENLQKLAEKIVKGLAFIESHRLIDADTDIEHHDFNEEDAKPIEEFLKQFGHAHSRGPGIEVVRAVISEGKISECYKITIWGEIILYVSVLRKSAQNVVQPDA